MLKGRDAVLFTVFSRLGCEVHLQPVLDTRKVDEEYEEDFGSGRRPEGWWRTRPWVVKGLKELVRSGLATGDPDTLDDVRFRTLRLLCSRAAIS